MRLSLYQAVTSIGIRYLWCPHIEVLSKCLRTEWMNSCLWTLSNLFSPYWWGRDNKCLWYHFYLHHLYLSLYLSAFKTPNESQSCGCAWRGAWRWDLRGEPPWSPQGLADRACVQITSPPWQDGFYMYLGLCRLACTPSHGSDAFGFKPFFLKHQYLLGVFLPFSWIFSRLLHLFILFKAFVLNFFVPDTKHFPNVDFLSPQHSPLW